MANNLSTLLTSTRTLMIKIILNQMSHPMAPCHSVNWKAEWDYKSYQIRSDGYIGRAYVHGYFYGCSQGYYGSTISLFMIMKREIRMGLLGDGPNYRSPNIARGVRSSCISIRRDAEKDFATRLKVSLNG